MTGVLSGLRVVEISAFVAAPLGGATLAELGADVVRIDPIGGAIDAQRWPLHQGGASLYWNGLNQGKRSMTVDSRTDLGRQVVADLIVNAGVCITNIPVADWMDHSRLSARRPDLITVAIVGNRDGSTAVDYTVNAAFGFPMVTGPESHDGPVNHVLPAWDLITGHMAVTSILAALLQRDRTGEGQLITIALSDVALSVAGHLGFLAEASLNAEPRPRLGNSLYGSYAADLPTADGRRVIVVALTSRQWRSLVAVTGSAEAIAALERETGADLSREGDRYAHRAAISRIIAPWVAARPLADVRAALESGGVLWGPYQTFKQLIAEDPRASLASPMLQRVEQPGVGPVLTVRSPLSFAGRDALPARPAPRLGEHTREVLAGWLGYDADRIAALLKGGVIAPLG